MVGAGITLCLDILHHSEAEREFADHTKLVDQAVVLLGRYDGSALAHLARSKTQGSCSGPHSRKIETNPAWLYKSLGACTT